MRMPFELAVSHEPPVGVQEEAFLSFHSSLEISPSTRDSHISTAPATRPVFVEQRKTARRIYLGGWESGNPEAGFPLSHRPDQPAAQGKNHFEKQLKTKAVYTKLLTPPQGYEKNGLTVNRSRAGSR